MEFVDSWEVYAGSIEKIKAWYAQWENTMPGGSMVSDNTVSSGSGAEPDSSENGGMEESMPESSSNAGQSGEAGNGTPGGSGEADSGEAGNGTPGESEAPSGNETPGGNVGAETEEQVPSRSPEEVQYMTVEDDYFSDAVFIGDSRTVGMFEYGGLEEISTFYASTGLTVYTIFDTPIVTVPGQREKQTIEQALTENKFSKIYLMIGINEMGTGTVETFMEKYKEVVAHLRELQPDAVIYLQGIMKVTTERSNQGDYITNEGIEARNVEIEKLANYVDIYYLDVNPLVCDESGGMIPDYTFDGVHLKGQYVPIWKDYLKSHAVMLD